MLDYSIMVRHSSVETISPDMQGESQAEFFLLRIWLLTVSSIQPRLLNWIQFILMWFLSLTDLNTS